MSTDFEYLNLADVNPEILPIPEGEYTFRIISAERPTFTYKQDQPDKGITAGDESSYIKFGLAIVDDPEWAGRRVYQSLFPDKNTPRYLRLVMDATGVPQESGMTLNDWLTALVAARATFTVPTFNKFNKKTGKDEVTVRFSSAKPAA